MNLILVLLLSVLRESPVHRVDPQEATDLVLAGEERRWSHIDSFRATIIRTVENSDKIQAMLNELAGKSKASTVSSGKLALQLTAPPQISSVSQAIIAKGLSARYDRSIFTEAESDNQIIVTPESFTLHDPSTKSVKIAPHSGGALEYMHPRSLAFFMPQISLPSLLLSSQIQVVSAEFVDGVNNDLLQLELTSSDDSTYVLLFDPSRDFVITRLWKLLNENELAFASFVDYTPIEFPSGEVTWFPTSSEQRLYTASDTKMTEIPPKGATDKLPEGWNQRISYAIEDLETGLDVASDTFELTYDEGTRINNRITGEVRVVPKVGSDSLDNFALVFWVSLAVCGLAALIALTLIVRAKAHS